MDMEGRNGEKKERGSLGKPTAKYIGVPGLATTWGLRGVIGAKVRNLQGEQGEGRSVSEC